MPDYTELDDFKVNASDVMRLIDSRSLITTVSITWSGSRSEEFVIRVGLLDGTERTIIAKKDMP